MELICPHILPGGLAKGIPKKADVVLCRFDVFNDIPLSKPYRVDTNNGAKTVGDKVSFSIESFGIKFKLEFRSPNTSWTIEINITTINDFFMIVFLLQQKNTN
jgi:hypothetical protein